MEKRNIKHIFILALFMLCSVFSVQAQRGARITNEGTSAVAPSNFAILDLSSADKGFLLPRMSTVERNEIEIDKNTNNGLAIFNTITDCIEYYNLSLDMWMSLCGDDLPAEFSILPSQCDDVKIIGGYYKDVVLNQTNGILIKVTASTSGTYSIYADSKNGYSFSHQGKFPAPGVYTIFLKAEGKPTKGYAAGAKGDEIKFQLNGVVSDCVKHIFVDTQLPVYTITSVNTVGKYYLGLDVSDKEYLNLTVNVTRGGRYVIKTNNVNGVWFEGEGEFTSTTQQTVKLEAKGRPNKVGNSNFEVYANPQYASGKPIKAADGVYNTPQVEISLVDCTTTDYSHQAALGEALPENATMTVKVDVKAPGTGTFSMVDHATNISVQFKSDETEFKFDRNKTSNIQEVVLKVASNKRTPATSGNVAMHIYASDVTGVSPSCKPTMPVKINKTIKGIELKSNFLYNKTPYITPRTVMATSGNNRFEVVVSLDVPTAGTITMKTNTVNGIYFEGSQNLTAGQNRKMTLVAKGTSLTDLPNKDGLFTLTATHPGGRKEEATFNVDFVYRPMNIMGYGRATPNILNSDKGSKQARDLVLNNDLFGWNGIVRIAKINLLDEAGEYSLEINKTSDTRMKTMNDKSDIVFFMTGMAQKEDRLKDLYQASVEDKKLVLISGLSYSKGTGTLTANYYRYMHYFLSLFPDFKSSLNLSFDKHNDTRIIKGMQTFNLQNKYPTLFDDKFFKAEKLQTKNMLNTKLGGSISGVSGDYFSFSLKVNPPKDLEPLYYSESVNSVTGLIHKNAGLILLFNQNPLASITDSRGSARYPIYAKNNRPAASIEYTWDTTTTETHNSFHYLNILYWAIDYAQANQENKAKPTN
ncbi:hypothetical protein VSP20_05465 [Myroides phaeus]|uniref:hypothetical protein n=1 Tax=Myroides phaeus TaxID=702745 RepID=UPI002DB8FD8F|nr:hypothetical protein [Myroides phaeus]MEC4116414.1 hypothetical protein [Myroides phaeus]